MTQGVIIYVLGEKVPDDLQTRTHYPRWRQLTGALEVVVFQAGGPEVDGARHFLLSLGCDTIHLLVATAERDQLHPLSPLVRLTGVSRMARALWPPSRPWRMRH
jgi:hypothetical protein